MPLLTSPKDEGDGGYAVADFRNVQEELGTMEDLRKLAKKCHRNKNKYLLRLCNEPYF